MLVFRSITRLLDIVDIENKPKYGRITEEEVFERYQRECEIVQGWLQELWVNYINKWMDAIC